MIQPMVTEIQELVDRYVRWLQDKTTLRQVDDWVEITTPYLDRHNDHLQMYAKKQGTGYLLTDDGYILNDLELQGCKLDSPKRQALLKQALNGFGVRLSASTGALEVPASADNFPQRKHAMVQAMLAVNDLFYLASPNVANLFYEDVVAWLETNDVRFTQGVKFAGKSGYDRLFDFVIPRSPKHKQPERIVQTINRPSKAEADEVVLKWFDTKDTRSPDSKMFTIVNDIAGVPSGVLEEMRAYGISSVPWSERATVVHELAA
jgi:hypothetical protein